MNLTDILFFVILVSEQAKNEKNKKMETSTTTTTQTISDVNIASASPLQFTDGDLAICTLLMIIISMQLLGAAWKTLIGIKNKYPVYD